MIENPSLITFEIQAHKENLSCKVPIQDQCIWCSCSVHPVHSCHLHLVQNQTEISSPLICVDWNWSISYTRNCHLLGRTTNWCWSPHLNSTWAGVFLCLAATAFTFGSSNRTSCWLWGFEAAIGTPLRSQNATRPGVIGFGPVPSEL